MGSKNRVQVRIHGKEYTLVGSESYEYIQKVAMYIDRKMNDVTGMNDKLSTSMVAVLTAANVADDYFKSQLDADQLRAQVQQIVTEQEKGSTKLKEYEQENAKLKDEIQKLKIDFAKKETELEDFVKSFDSNSKDNTVKIDNVRKMRAK